MKILALSHISELLGGAERSLLDILDSWSKDHNIQPEFILREPIKSLAGELDKRGWKYHALRYTFWSETNPPTKAEDLFNHSTLNSQAIEDIERIIQKFKPDVVLTNSIVCPWAALAAHFQKVPHVWIVREYGDLDHGRIFEIGREKTFEDVGNLSNLVVANSNTLADHIKQYVNETKVTFLYNPFDIEAVKRQSVEKVPNPFKDSTSLKLIMTSNIARTKGHKETVEAVGMLNRQGYNVELCLLGRSGDAQFSKELDEEVQKYGLKDRVHLPGLVSNVLAYVNLADVGIVASQREAFGRVTFEYMLLSKPVVGADSGATPELVETGKTAFLFKPGDVQSLMAAIKKYADDRELAQAHGRAGQKRVLALLGGEHNVEALYQKVELITKGKGQSKPEPINFTHRWLDYQRNAKEFIKTSGETSLKKMIKMRLRGKAKSAYWRARSARGKLTGK